MKRKNINNIGFSPLNINDEKCPICLEKLKNCNLTITSCGHKFCHTCLDCYSIQNSSCPICRSNLQTSKIRKLNSDDIYLCTVISLENSTIDMLRLIERIKQKFLILFADHEIDDNIIVDEKDKDDKNEIFNLREKISLKLDSDLKFNMNINQYLVQEITSFALRNNIDNGFLLKNIIES
tara:strand:- start:664 stop:1203 length:540 start_codon:yes stop_codon:yes gene_type:complete